MYHSKDQLLRVSLNSYEHFSDNQGKDKERERHSGFKHPLLAVVGAGVVLGGGLLAVKALTDDEQVMKKDFAQSDPYQKLPVVTKTINKDKEEDRKV